MNEGLSKQRKESDALSVEQLQLESLGSLIRTLRHLAVPEARIKALVPPGHPLGYTLKLMVTPGMRGPAGLQDATAKGAAQARMSAKNTAKPSAQKAGSGIQPQVKVDARELPRQVVDEELAVIVLKMAAKLVKSLARQSHDKKLARGLERVFGLLPTARG